MENSKEHKRQNNIVALCSEEVELVSKASQVTQLGRGRPTMACITKWPNGMKVVLVRYGDPQMCRGFLRHSTAMLVS